MTVAARIAQLVRLLLGTDKTGEIVGAAAAIKRTLATAGIDHHHLADAIQRGLHTSPAPAPEPDDWRELVRYTDARRELLSANEVDFIDALLGYRRSPSAKQLKWLNDIVARLRRGGA